MENKNIIINDIAIGKKEEDLLNYYPYAEKIQSVIQGYANNPEPLTIGIYGKWGAGKSSLLNLIERHIEMFHKDKDDKPYIKFHYNPWIYQTKEEMLYDFFETLTRKLVYSGNDTLKKAGKFIKKYSKYLKAVKLSASVGVPKIFNAGISVEPYEILKRLGEDLEGEEKSLNELKKQIDDILKESDKKIIIFIDDVDRLDKDEIFTLFKLIKINADFKNLIFIICLDQEYVAKAIHHRYGNDEKSGKDFLEKIINIPLELPLIEEADLDRFVKEKIKPILSSKKIKEADLKELYDSLSGGYFSSPREVVRVINSFAFSFYAIGDEVNVHDLFWIEYLKVKYIKTYNSIKDYASRSGIKTNMLFIDKIDFNSPFAKDKNETGFRKDLMDKHKESYPIINFLFPMIRTGTVSAYQTPKIKPTNVLDAELRINHMNHFEKYFSFHTKGKISELMFSNFKALINSDKDNEALEIMHRMIQNTGEWKIVYRISSEIEVLSDELHDKFVWFLIKHINEFKGRSDTKPFNIEIVQSIAKKLVEKRDEKKKLIISIPDELDYLQTCWYLGVFTYDGNEIEYMEEIEKKLIAKAKTIENHPFFKDRNVAKMTMDIWSRLEFDEFQEYILQYLNSEDNIVSFIRSFTYLWNGTINGVFKEENYQYISNVLGLDCNLIFDKIIRVLPEYQDNNDPDQIEINWSEYDGNSNAQNILQFIYWHLKSNIKDGIDNEDDGAPIYIN
ncbi:KAP family NTPase [Psychroserpens sp. SPM9]|uniref:KAP family P-loop NTPase fold protein n=1 Tax=Psychroserpens sp. SPM9 TaxID=2975598 RepID=UPI0021A3DA69|nr:KAP family NTPase [Psychroserpens sp. SPM9]MDG5490584.1 KAP family NTPase [Psychroserpens sp. SPM9]